MRTTFPETCIDESKLKELMKEAFAEALEDRKEIFYEILTDVMEDMALAGAIEEGESTEEAGKQEVLDILRGRYA
jgi:hypothetical protein